MSFQPLPYAKRQRVTTDSPNLDPPAARPPAFHEPVASRQDTNSSKGDKTDRHRVSLHGNFVGYYQRRRADLTGLDPRLELLERDWFEGKKVLDVGCNSGLVTVEIAQRMGAARVVGVDIDEELIRLAKRTGELTSYYEARHHGA